MGSISKQSSVYNNNIIDSNQKMITFIFLTDNLMVIISMLSPPSEKIHTF